MRTLASAGARPSSKSGRRKYRKLQRQAAKNRCDVVTQARTHRREKRRHQRLVFLKPGNIVRVYFRGDRVSYAAEVLYRVGPHRAQILILGYSSSRFPGSPRDLPVKNNFRGLRLGKVFCIHWEDVKGLAQSLTRLVYAQRALQKLLNLWRELDSVAACYDKTPLPHPTVAEKRLREAWQWAWWGRFGTHMPFKAQAPQDFPKDPILP